MIIPNIVYKNIDFLFPNSSYLNKFLKILSCIFLSKITPHILPYNYYATSILYTVTKSC